MSVCPGRRGSDQPHHELSRHPPGARRLEGNSAADPTSEASPASRDSDDKALEMGPQGGTQPSGRRAHLVGVPQADGAAQGHLPHQQVVHPAEGELQVPHLVLLQVPVHLLCGTDRPLSGALACAHRTCAHRVCAPL